MQNDQKLICVGIITSAHGIHGAVKIRSYTEDPLDIENYSPLLGKDGVSIYKIKILSENGDMFIANVNDVKSRNDAEILKGTELFIYRDMLPETEEDEFYYEDLIGMKVKSESAGKIVGKILAVYNHGAGDILEIQMDNGKTELVSFTLENVPEVNIKEAYVVVKFPEIEFLTNNDN